VNTKGLIKSSTIILLSTLLVTSLLAVLSIHAASSGMTGTPGASTIPASLLTKSTIPASTDPTKEITVTADVSVQESGTPPTSRTDRIAARSWRSGSYNIRSFLKFDISGIVPGSIINSAKLKLQCYTITNYIVGAGFDVEIRAVADNTWDEDTMIWSTQPAMGSVLSYFWLNDENMPGYNPLHDNSWWYENDITSYVQYEYGLGHTLVSLGMKCITENYPGDTEYHGSYYYAKEFTEVPIAPENYPRLIIDYTPPDVYAVDVSILPDSKEGLQGSTQTFTVEVNNPGGRTENVQLIKGDNTGWVTTLDNTRFDNIPLGETRTTTLRVTISGSAPIGTRDAVWVQGTVMENLGAQKDNASCVLTCTDSISTPADCYVGELAPNTNLDNTYNRLQSWTRPTWGNSRIFIKFPLDDIQPGKNVASAKLMLYCWGASDDDIDAQVCRVDDDSWDEKLITWNNKPSIGDVLDTQTLTSWPPETRGIENSWIAWEVRDFVTDQRYYTGDNTVSFCIKAEVENTSGNYLFEGRTWSGIELRPKLVITFGAVQRAVSLSILPVHRIGDNGVTENFTVTVMNKGNVIDNYTLENTDNATWSKTLTPRLDNVKPGESRTATLSVTIPGDAVPGAVDNIKVTARSMENTLITDSENCSASVKEVNSWVVAGYSPRIDNYGVAVTNAGNYIYVANSNTLGTRANFMRYDPTAGGQWTYLATPSIATPFKNGTVLAWDKGNYIYALCGGSYSDNADNSSARHYFYRYKISTNTWENLKPTGNDNSPSVTLGVQGAGDAMAVAGSYIYAIVGNRQVGSTFWRYNTATNTWENRNLSTSGWSSTDDGCSMVWTGGDNLYAFQGQTSTITKSFSAYSIPGNSWTSMTDAPSGVDDGGSLLWFGGDNIYALLGGNPSNENIRDNCFFVYSQSGNSWTQLENLPQGIGDPNGQRMGGIGSKNIYVWRGAANPTGEYDPVLWQYTLPLPAVAATGTASIRMAGTGSTSAPFLWGMRKAAVTVNLWVNNGDNLRLIFLKADNKTVESENVVWSRTAPDAQNVILTNLVVPHDNHSPYPSDYVKRVKLVLTDSAGNVILDNMAWYTVVQNDWGSRITWIILKWALHSSLQKSQLGSEIQQIILKWALCPTARDQRDFSQA